MVYSELMKGNSKMLKWNLMFGITMLVLTGCTSDIDRANDSASTDEITQTLFTPPSTFEFQYQYTEKEVDLMARTLWAEARGQSDKEMTAVANVIINRLLDGRWGSTVTDVIMFPWAFSCHYVKDKNHKMMRALDRSNFQFVRAENISREVLSGRLSGNLEDVANGATHYHAHYVNPRWASKKNVVAKFSGHVFYAEVQDYKYEILASNGKFNRSAVEKYVTTHQVKRHKPVHHKKRKKVSPKTNSIEIARTRSQGKVFARR